MVLKIILNYEKRYIKYLSFLLMPILDFGISNVFDSKIQLYHTLLQ